MGKSKTTMIIWWIIIIATFIFLAKETQPIINGDPITPYAIISYILAVAVIYLYLDYKD